jgi:hypothetical protein
VMCSRGDSWPRARSRRSSRAASSLSIAARSPLAPAVNSRGGGGGYQAFGSGVWLISSTCILSSPAMR